MVNKIEIRIFEKDSSSDRNDGWDDNRISNMQSRSQL